MKRIFVLISSVLLSAQIITSYADNRKEETFMRRTFSASSVKELEATTPFGHITVSGDAVSEAVVEVYVLRNENKTQNSLTNLIMEFRKRKEKPKKDWSQEEIEQYIDENFHLKIGVENGKLYAEAKPKSKMIDLKQYDFSISFKISVPKKVNSNLDTNNGNIQIDGLSGKHNLKTGFGYFSVKKIIGSVTGTTANGNILITNTRANVDLRTGFGWISAKNCKGKTSLKTASGSVKFDKMDGIIDVSTGFGYLSVANIVGSITGKTTNGSIEIKNCNADIDLSTNYGYISAKDCSGALKLKTTNGNVVLDGISGNLNAITSFGTMNVTMISSVESVILSSGKGNIKLTLPFDLCYDLNVKAYSVETVGMQNYFSGNMNIGSLVGTIGNGGAQVDVKTPWRATLAFK